MDRWFDRWRNPELGKLLLRLAIGLVFFTHGWQKLFIGGVGQTASFFGDALGLPAPGLLAWVVALMEVFGGLGLILGLFVPYLALFFVLHQVLGILLVHMHMGWFVVGPGQGGVEFSLVLLCGGLTLLLAGSGMAALDDKLFRRRREAAAGAGAVGGRGPSEGVGEPGAGAGGHGGRM